MTREDRVEKQAEKQSCSRRDFLKFSAKASVGVALGGMVLSGCAGVPMTQPNMLFRDKPLGRKVRVGFVGIGSQGSGHVRNLSKITDAEVVAVCDIRESQTKWAQDKLVAAGRPKPTAYTKGDYDFLRMCETEDLDLVYTATPWRWHVPICVAAMKSGKHAATEVPAAPYLEDCWKLVETAEKYQKHCMMMENACYDRMELMIWNMVRQGLFGELLHAECGYLHDLRGHKLGEKVYQGMWRVYHSIKRNADLYPTHGLGPVAQWMDINRGNQFDHLVSMSCNARGLPLYAEKKYGPESKWTKAKYKLGDVVNTLIRTKNGQTILITHDTNLPRPYSRKIFLQGTKGLVRKYPEEKIHIEGISEGHGWEEAKDYYEKYDHPLWKAMQEKSKGAGHGGLDFIEDYRLVECIKEGKPTDMNVYDAAAWSAVTAISEKSIAKKSSSVDFPDFTRGKWKTTPRMEIMGV
ncbi:MAG: Gfo/Idh/MocA family oxidoreductase [Sedimentisphaerales bacterium]|nr:Gfo/Idh/MocA family oxidoreductase [Sedimentisphaerales bacterium]